MERKALIIYPQINASPSSRILLEIGMFVELFRECEWETDVWIIHDEVFVPSFIEKLRKNSPDVVFYYIEPRQKNFLDHVAPFLKEAFVKTHFCCGGRLPTLDPESVISIMGIDSLVIGEAETAMVELLKALSKEEDYYTIRNFWFKTPLMEVNKNPLRPLVKDLDVLPYPDRSFYNARRFLDCTHGALPIMASRGCTFNCLFCSTPPIRDVYRGKGDFFRTRSVNHIIGEIQELRTRLPFSGVVFVDEIFPTQREWLITFIERYHSRVNLPFHITASVEQLNKETMEFLVMSGCETVTLGIETGNELFRKRISNRNLKNEKIVEATEKLRELGIKVHVTVMIGLPLETKELMEETVQFTRELAPDDISVSIYFPFPSTPLYHYCKGKKYISDRPPSELEEGESILDLPYISAEDIESSYFNLKAIHCSRQLERAGKALGYMDILSHLKEKDTSRECEDSVTCDYFTLGGDSHFCLAQMPNTKMSLPIHLKPQSYFKFGIGIEPCLRRIGSRAFFRFTIVLIQNGVEKLLFEKYLNPDRDSKNLEWALYELPLLDVAEGRANLRMEYRTSFKSSRSIRGLWIHPYLTQREKEPDSKEVPYTEEDFNRIQKELVQARLLLEKAEKDYQGLLVEKEGWLEEKEKNLQLIGELEARSLRLEEEKDFLEQQISRLEEIRREYEKTLCFRLKKVFKKK